MRKKEAIFKKTGYLIFEMRNIDFNIDKYNTIFLHLLI